MRQLPRRAVAVWFITVVAGLAAFAWALATAPGQPFDVLAAAALIVGGALANLFTLRLPSNREQHNLEVTVASAAYVTAFVYFPTCIALLIVAFAYSSIWVAKPRARPWFKNLFNVSQYLLAALAAGLVWHAVAPAGAPLTSMRLAWLVVPILLYFAINTGLVSLMVAMASGMPFEHVWFRSNRSTYPSYFGMLFVGALLANLWTVAPWTLALAAVPLIAIYFAFKSTVDLEQQTLAALFQLAEIIDGRDSYTHRHSVRVGEYSERLALAMGLTTDTAYLVSLAGRLHDIGKCAVNNEVLLKPGALTDDERAHMCSHAAIGGSMLQHFKMFHDVAAWVRGHHERWDGRGYPDGLAGERIPIGARIIAVADSFDAMTTTRPYRVALPHEEAVRRLQESRGSQWDPEVVDTFLDLLERQQIRPSQVAARPAERPVATPT